MNKMQIDILLIYSGIFFIVYSLSTSFLCFTVAILNILHFHVTVSTSFVLFCEKQFFFWFSLWSRVRVHKSSAEGRCIFCSVCLLTHVISVWFNTQLAWMYMKYNKKWLNSDWQSTKNIICTVFIYDFWIPKYPNWKQNTKLLGKMHETIDLVEFSARNKQISNVWCVTNKKELFSKHKNGSCIWKKMHSSIFWNRLRKRYRIWSTTIKAKFFLSNSIEKMSNNI